MIVTVTPNPSIDRTLRIGQLERGAVVRATSATAEAGGKGINVSRALATEGIETVAVVPVSDASGALLVGLLGASTTIEPVNISGEIRVNITLVETDGTVTKVNEPGPALGASDVEGLLDRASERAPRADWLAGCGSLPPGAPDDRYVSLAARLTGGVRVAIDTDGTALRACIGRPFALLKPNHAELQDAVGMRLSTLGEVVSAAEDLVAGGAAALLVSLGRDGAVLIDGREACHAEAPIDDVVNPVGAGDALLAGYLASTLGRPLSAGQGGSALATAVAWSVAACRSPGTRMRPVREEDHAAVVRHDGIDRDRVIAS